MENPLIPQIGSRNNFIINMPTTQEKKEKNKVPLNLHKEIVTVLLVMNLFLPEERNKEAITVFRGSLEK